MPVGLHGNDGIFVPSFYFLQIVLLPDKHSWTYLSSLIIADGLHKCVLKLRATAIISILEAKLLNQNEVKSRISYINSW